MEKKGFTIYISIIVLNFLCFCTYGLPITYFPSVAQSKGFTNLEIGLIFSMYPLFSFIFGFIIGKKMSNIGKKQILISSQIILSLSTLSFGLASLPSQKILCLILALISRGSQGLAVGAYTTTVYSYIPDMWPNEIDQRIVVVEIFLSLGIGVGPLLGSFFYEFCGYLFVFAIPSIILLFIGVILSIFVLPNMNIKANSLEDEQRNMIKKLSFCKTFANKEIIYVFFTQVIGGTSFTLIMPGFENKILSLGETPEIASLIFFFQPLGYLLTCILLFFLKCENRKGLFFISLFFNLLGLCFIGIDEILSIEKIYVLILITMGLFLNGIITALALVPFLSECIQALKINYPDFETPILNNMASGLFNGSLALTEFEGPIIGGILCDFFGFSGCCLIYSLFALVFFLFFASHGNGWKAFYSFFKKEKEKKMEIYLGKLSLLEY